MALDGGDGESKFEALGREETLTSRVIEQLERMLLSSQFKSGSKMPAERELARQFGVSRTVIREAVSGLAAKDLLEVKGGSGTVVRRPSPKSFSTSLALFMALDESPFDYSQVNEVRRMLEVEIAGLAAERRTAEDIATLESLFEEALASTQDKEHFSELDVAFHGALAAATHNGLFFFLIESLREVMLEVRRAGYDVPGASETGINDHKAILDEVKAGSVSGARQAMAAHLESSSEIVQRASQK